MLVACQGRRIPLLWTDWAIQTSCKRISTLYTLPSGFHLTAIQREPSSDSSVSGLSALVCYSVSERDISYLWLGLQVSV